MTSSGLRSEPALYLDSAPVSAEFLDRTFPFRIEFDLAEGPRITHAGVALVEWLGDGMVGDEIAAHFAVTRPADLVFEHDALEHVREKVVFLEHRATGRQLRGQMLVQSPGRALFVGSPHITGGDKLSDLGLTLGCFAPHDATADVIVMAALGAMRVADIERQHASLIELDEARAEADRSASTDPLTGLANRRALWAAWERLIAAGDLSAHSLLYIDVDRFKRINDEHGHSVGDDVLRALASRMQANVKTGDLVARLGGDEFAVLLRDLDVVHVEGVAYRLLDQLARPIETNGALIEVSVSMGVVTRTETTSLDDALRDADTAMFHGRNERPGRATVYRDRMGFERENVRTLTAELSEAIHLGVDLVPYFQPVVELPSQRIIGFEALARWHHPTEGVIAPGRFIQIAERSGMVGALDRLILRQALKELKSWRERWPHLVLHANLSGRSLEADLVAWISGLLDGFDLSPDALVVELTESWFIGDEGHDTIANLSALGVELQLDDFGTGFSSLTRLHSFPLTGLKIDRSFVAGMVDSERDGRLVASTIGFARSLGLNVVAEGVETAEVAELLARFECDQAQGYYFSRPVEAHDALALLAGD